MAGIDGVRALMIVLGGAIVLSGCGGSSPKRPATTSAGGAEHRSTAPRLSVADENAFVEIARASGELRAGTAAVALGKTRRISGRGEMASAIRLVAGLRPRDRRLSRLKRQIDAALRAVLAARSDPRSERGAAKAAIGATTRINGGLRRYADRHPSLVQVIPD
jgi:hypothetical protein